MQATNSILSHTNVIDNFDFAENTGILDTETLAFASDLVTPNNLLSDEVANNNFATLEFTPTTNIDEAGNSLAEAKNWGLITGTKQDRGYVDGNDIIDYYSFRVEETGTLEFNLTGLSSNANIQLLNSIGKTLKGGYKSGVSDETGSYAFTPGNYYLQVYSKGGSTDYNLDLNLDVAELNQDEAGNSLYTAKDLGTIIGKQDHTGSVGSSDRT